MAEIHNYSVYDTYIPLWCGATVVISALLYWLGMPDVEIFEKMGIPYRKPWPFIGNMTAVFKQTILDSDKRFLELFPSRLAGSFQGCTPVIDCADVEFLKEVTIKKLPYFVNRRALFDFEGSKVLSYQLFTLRGDHWKHVRSLLTPTFTSGKLKQMYPVINDCADKFVKHLKMADATPVVIKDYSAGYTMDVIASTAFGMDIDAQANLDHPFIQHAGTFFGIPRNKSWISKFRQGAAIVAILACPQSVLRYLKPFGISFIDEESVEYFYRIVERVLDSVNDGNPDEAKNFITMCTEKMIDIKSVDPSSVRTTSAGTQWSTQGLSRDDVCANAVAFFAAGYETTATALQFFCYSMAVYPEFQQKLYESIAEETKDGKIGYERLQKLKYLDWCLSESLRIFPPVLRFDRVALEDVEVCGKLVPKGQIVNILTYAMHQNPEYWEDPASFKPERFAPENRSEIHQYAYVPFGSGGRSCIAKRLALLEIKVAVVKLLTEFRFEKTSDTPEPKDLKFKKLTGFLQSADPLKVSAVPRN